MSSHNLRLPNRDTTYAVLIGCSQYQSSHQLKSLDDLPAVENNITGMFSVLTDEDYGSIQADHCAILHNPDTVQIVHTLQDFSSKAKDTIIVYYAGHGLLDSNGVFYLAAHNTVEAYPQVSAIPFTVIHDIFRRMRASNRILILDCCFANRATEVFKEDGKRFMGMDKDTNLPRGIQISGTYILTAAGSDENAWAPKDARYTTFSGALIGLLHEGIPGNMPYISPPMAYEAIVARMPEDAPLPKQSLTDTVDRLALVRNRAYTVPIRIGDRISTGVDGHITIEPHSDFHEIIDEANQLKAQGELEGANKRYEQAKLLSRIQWENATYDHATLLIEQGRFAEGEKAHREAIDQGINRSFGALAELLERQGRVKEAEDYYRKAIDTGFVRYIRSLDDLLLQQGKSAEAETFYRQFIQEGYTDLWPDWAEFLAIQGRDEAAMGICIEAIRGGEPPDPRLRSTDAAYNLGDFYMRRDDIVKGTRFLQLAACAGDMEADQFLAKFFKSIEDSYHSNPETDQFNKILLTYLLKALSQDVQAMGEACSPSSPQFLTEFQKVLKLYYPEMSLDRK